MTVSDSWFASSIARYGGGVSSFGSKVLVKDCNFLRPVSSVAGGAFLLEVSDVEVENVTIRHGTASFRCVRVRGADTRSGSAEALRVERSTLIRLDFRDRALMSRSVPPKVGVHFILEKAAVFVLIDRTCP